MQSVPVRLQLLAFSSNMYPYIYVQTKIMEQINYRQSKV